MKLTKEQLKEKVNGVMDIAKVKDYINTLESNQLTEYVNYLELAMNESNVKEYSRRKAKINKVLSELKAEIEKRIIEQLGGSDDIIDPVNQTTEKKVTKTKKPSEKSEPKKEPKKDPKPPKEDPKKPQKPKKKVIACSDMKTLSPEKKVYLKLETDEVFQLVYLDDVKGIITTVDNDAKDAGVIQFDAKIFSNDMIRYYVGKHQYVFSITDIWTE